MTQPTRRQLMAGSLAVVGAAGAPAIAVASRIYGDELAALDHLVEGLPQSSQVMVLLNHIKTFPIEERRRLVEQFRYGSFPEYFVERLAQHLEVPA